MINEVTTVTFSQNPEELLNQVQYCHDSILIKKDGETIAALVDAPLFERIRRFRSRFDKLSQQIADAYVNVPQQEGIDEIDTIIADIRRN